MGATAALVSIGLAVGGSAYSATTRVKAGKAQQKVADYNAQVANLQAEDAVTRGAEAEARYRTQVEGLIGTQRAGFSGQNVLVDEDSPLDVQADAAYLGELDALAIRNNAAREAWGYSVQAEDARARGDIAAREGRTAAVGTLLGTGTSLLEARYGFGRAGKT